MSLKVERDDTNVLAAGHTRRFDLGGAFRDRIGWLRPCSNRWLRTAASRSPIAPGARPSSGRARALPTSPAEKRARRDRAAQEELRFAFHGRFIAPRRRALPPRAGAGRGANERAPSTAASPECKKL